MNEAEAIEIAENEIITLKRYLKEASMVMHWDRFKKMIEALTLAIQSLKQKPRLEEGKLRKDLEFFFKNTYCGCDAWEENARILSMNICQKFGKPRLSWKKIEKIIMNSGHEWEMSQLTSTPSYDSKNEYVAKAIAEGDVWE